jgi:hypothetical protein
MANLELRCATQTATRGVDPIGTAPAYDAYVLVEVPLPWPAAITDHPLLGDVGRAVEAAGVRASVLGLVPDHDEHGRHRVVVYRRPEGPFRRYRRLEAMTDPAGLGRVTAELLAAPLPPDATADGDGDGDGVTADLLICTHGRRDRCCGSFGTNLFTAVGARHVRAGVRSWRVSHTGGHRFAPTAIVLPEGHLWSWLDGDLVDAIVHRRGTPDEVLDHYRGSSAMAAPPVQVAEREAFRREGWSWLDAHRVGSVVDEDGDRFEVRLDATRPDGSTVTYEAVVERTGTVAQPVCGEVPTGAGNGKSDSIWVLARFDAVDR